MLPPLAAIPVWTFRLAWSAVILLSAYLLGRFLSRRVCHRLRVWAATTTTWPWDELMVPALQRAIPLWSLLAGSSLALELWPLSLHLRTLLTTAMSVLLWLSLTLIASRLAGRLVILYVGHTQPGLPVTSLTAYLARLFVILFGGLMILHGLGVSIVPLLTALGVGGLAVALALQDTLSNLFAGCYLSMGRQIRVGDYVQLDGGHEGYVEDIG